MSTRLPSAVPWPTGAAPLPIASLRPVLERLASLALTHPDDLTPIAGLAQSDEEVSADPPPALEQIVDEFGGIVRHGITELTLLVDQRTDVGPYTLLGPAETYYPLHEDPESAVVLAIDPDGTPGAVYGIGEDLALQLAASDLGGYLNRVADALQAAVDPAVIGDGDVDTRAERAEQVMDRELYREVLGMQDLGDVPDVALQQVTECAPDLRAPGVLPEGTIAVADLREAPRGARVDLVDADLPGDPLERSVVFSHRGLVVCVLDT